MQKHEVIIRIAKPSDQAYVATTWIKAVREDAHVVDAVLDRPRARALIAHPPGNVDRIHGWICYELQPRAALIHMAYVRPELRRGGIGRELVQAIGAGRHIPHVVTAKELPVWLLPREQWMQMHLRELMTR